MKNQLILLLLLFSCKCGEPTFEITADMSPVQVYDVIKLRGNYLLETTIAQLEKCITDTFTSDPTITAKKLKISCLGRFNNILIKTYHRIVKDLHDAFNDVINIEFEPFEAELTDEIFYFKYLMEIFVKRDFMIGETLNLVKKSTKYHVHPQKFENLLKIVEKQIIDFDSMFLTYRKRRNGVIATLKTMLEKREKELEQVADTMENE